MVPYPLLGNESKVPYPLLGKYNPVTKAPNMGNKIDINMRKRDNNKWLYQKTIDYDSDNNKLTDKDLIKNIFYILIINFCCSLYSKLPGKINSFSYQNISVYWNQFATDFNICCVKIEAIDHWFCFWQFILCINLTYF